MPKVFGLDSDSNYGPKDVREALLNCFYEAHCIDTGIEQKGEELTRDYCNSIVKKAFQETGGDFDNPNKEQIIKVMNRLREFASNFRTNEVIQKNYMKMYELVQKLKD